MKNGESHCSLVGVCVDASNSVPAVTEVCGGLTFSSQLMLDVWYPEIQLGCSFKGKVEQKEDVLGNKQLERRRMLDEEEGKVEEKEEVLGTQARN